MGKLFRAACSFITVVIFLYSIKHMFPVTLLDEALIVSQTNNELILELDFYQLFDCVQLGASASVGRQIRGKYKPVEVKQLENGQWKLSDNADIISGPLSEAYIYITHVCGDVEYDVNGEIYLQPNSDVRLTSTGKLDLSKLDWTIIKENVIDEK